MAQGAATNRASTENPTSSQSLAALAASLAAALEGMSSIFPGQPQANDF